MDLASIIEAIIDAILKSFALPLAEDAITGKLSNPHTATVAESDPEVQQQAQEAIDQWDKQHP